MLKIDDENWSWDLTVLGQHISNFYWPSYNTVGPRNFLAVLDQCSHLVNDEINEALLKPVKLGYAAATHRRRGPAWQGWSALTSSERGLVGPNQKPSVAQIWVPLTQILPSLANPRWGPARPCLGQAMVIGPRWGSTLPRSGNYTIKKL